MSSMNPPSDGNQLQKGAKTDKDTSDSGKGESRYVVLSPTSIQDIANSIVSKWKSEGKRPRHSRLEIWDVVLTLLVLAATLGVLFYQTVLFNRQTAIIHNQLGNDRPWMGFPEAKRDSLTADSSGVLLTTKNYGRSAAIEAKFKTCNAIQHDSIRSIADCTHPDGWKVSGPWSVPPEGTMMDFYMGEDWLFKSKKTRYLIYFYGNITYTNKADEKEDRIIGETPFCILYNRAAGRFFGCGIDLGPVK